MDTKAIHGIFRFLDLPIEIRNEIYRYLFKGNYVMRYYPNPKYQDSKTESEPILNCSSTSDAEVGTIRCENVWIETPGYNMTMLRVSQQVYDEAWAVFSKENSWITITVNKAGYGADMKSRGFGVIYCGTLDHITQPVLKIRVNFPSLEPRKEEDTFLMSASGLSWLPRALWMTVGMKEMDLRIEMHRVFAGLPAEKEDDFLDCFYQIHGIRKATLVGGIQDTHKTRIPSELTTPHGDADDILQDLVLILGVFNDGWERGERHVIAELAEAAIAFLSDCFKIYGITFIIENVEVFNKIGQVTIRLAEGIAKARTELKQHESVIKYSTYAMGIPIGVRAISPISAKRMANLLMMRGEAYGAIGNSIDQLSDLLEAQKFMPTDKSVTGKLVTFKKDLDPDPLLALDKFKDLRVAVAQEEAAAYKKFDRMLDGKLSFRMLPNGGFVRDDRRSIPSDK